jgi:hypothetical protein
MSQKKIDTFAREKVTAEELRILNLCPICNLPRAGGPGNFNHGKCAEQMAVLENKSDTSKKRHINKAVANKYKKGILPPWMYD